jgi:hypothetical protein
MHLEAPPGAPFLLAAAATTLLVLHVGGGAVGMVSGAAALAFRKGGRLHRAAGNVFFVAMLVMAGVGAGVAPFLPEQQMTNTAGGVFAFYMVATGWAAVRRPAGVAGRFEVGAFIVALSIALAGLGLIALAAATGSSDGSPPQAKYLFATVAAIAAAGDLNLILRRGLSGVSRIARHLWRMCLGLFIAAGSFFLGQSQLFPKAIQDSPLLFVPPFAVLGLMVFWLLRVRLARRSKSGAANGGRRSPRLTQGNLDRLVGSRPA